MGNLVRLKPEYPERLSVPLCTGRIVRFSQDNQYRCLTDEEFARHWEMLVKVAWCNDLPETKEYQQRDKRCTSCEQKRDANKMKCDFEVVDGVRYCIRCGHRVGDKRINFRTCAKRGLGDRLYRLFSFFKVPHCQACSKRRRKLNELDRRVYRFLWRKVKWLTEFASRGFNATLALFKGMPG